MKIFSIVLILIFMAEPLWGTLAKSAVDNETVEEAIARLIAAHEADETAHLGTGESLETHKASDVIDHVEGSVVADKLSDIEMLWESNLSDHALWTKFDVNDYNWPGMFLPDTGTDDTYPRITLNIQNIIGSTIPVGVDYYFQAFMNVDNPPTTSYIELGFGITGTSNYDGFGFKAVHNQCSVYFKIGATNSTANIASFADGKKHVFRAMFVNSEQKVYFYVDGVEVASISKPDGTPATAAHFGFRLFAHDYTGESYALYQVRITVVGGNA
jgi:hypothetical protein